MTTNWCGGNTHELTLVFIKVFITFGTNWSFILNQILVFFPLFTLRLKLVPLAYNLWTMLLFLLCSSFSSKLVLVAKIWSLSLVITNFFFLTWKKMPMQCAIVPQSFNDILFINYKRIFFFKLHLRWNSWAVQCLGLQASTIGLQGPRVQSLFRELRSCMSHSTAKKKKKPTYT